MQQSIQILNLGKGKQKVFGLAIVLTCSELHSVSFETRLDRYMPRKR